MPSQLFHAGLTQMLTHTTGINYLGDTIKVMLVTSGYSPDPDDVYVDAGGGTGPIASELAVSGYARQTLASKTISTSTASNRVEVDAADVSFGAMAAGATIAGAVVFKDAGGADTANRIIAYLDVADTPTNGGTISLQFASNGFANINV